MNSKLDYILATIRHRETFIQSKDWQIVRVLVDNCADEHVCSPRDFEWIAIEPSRDPHLVSASGHKLKHYGEQAVPMKLLRWTQKSGSHFKCVKSTDPS